MQLSKANISVIGEDMALVEAGGRMSRTSFDVQFNPTEYSINKGAQYAEVAIPGLDTPLLQFVRGNNEQLTMDLFFDTTIQEGTDEVSMGQGAADVRDEIKDLLELVKIQPELHAPPRIVFAWGSLSFKAVVESIQQKFTLFSPEGTPLRATLSVTFREYKTLEEQLTGTPRASADRTKVYQVRRNETAHSIAAREYRDPRRWRAIADENGLENPRRLEPGRVLRIPPLDAAGGRGE